MQVELVQYFTPDGRKGTARVDVPEDVAEKAEKIKGMDLELCAEVLTTGEVALYISDNIKDIDLAIEIAENKPGENSPQNRFIKLINEFDVENVQQYYE